MADEKVVVELEARVDKYFARLAESKKRYEEFTGSIAKNSQGAQKSIEKANKGQVKSAKRTASLIERAVRVQSNAIDHAAAFQAQVTEESTDRIIAALNEQMLAREEDAGSAENSSRRVKKAFGALDALGLGSIILRTVKGSLEAASEIKQLSDSVGLSTERFTEATFAAQRYGVEQEELAGIFEDVSGSVNDLVFSSSGPLQDFLDQAGRKAGLTADSFIGLGSDEVLGLVAKTMEEAGQGGQQLTDTLRALSGDAVKLKPLLSDNAKELKSLSQEARAAGLVLNNETAEAAFNANAEIDKLGDVVRTKLTIAIAEAAPQIQAVTDKIVELLPTLIEWAGVAADIFAGLGIAIGEVAGEKVQVKVDTEDTEKQVKILNKEWNKLAKELIHLKILLPDLEEELAKTTSPKRVEELKAQIATGKQVTEIIEDRIDKIKGEIEWLEAGKTIKAQLFGLDKEREEAALAAAAAAEDAAEEAAKLAEIQAIKDARAAVAAANAQRLAAEQAKATEARVEREVMAIEALGRMEREQIELTQAARRESIDASKRSDEEKAVLRQKVDDEAAKGLAKVAEAEQRVKDKLAQEEEQRLASEFQANQDRLGFIAEIEAATARMNGRAVDAIQIELDAARARYEEELRLIDELIAKKGSTPEREAERAQAQANLVGVDEDEQNLREDALREIDDIAGPSGQSEFEAKLEAIEEYKEQRLEALAALQTAELEMVVDFNERVKQIEDEAAQQRLQARLEQAKELLSVTQNQLSGITAALQAAGKENTKAAKIAAKAQQVVALGTAIVDTAQGVAKALGTGNIPKAVIIGALGAIQVGIIASQTFKDGGVNIKGPGTGTSDSIPARISRGESVITAAATRGNELGLQGLNDGLSPAQAFGLPTINIPTPNVSVPAFAPQSNNSFRGGDVIVQGNVDQDTLPQLQAALRERDRSFSRNVNKVMDARERRTQSRQNRVLGR